MKEVFVLAGEASGDLHGANLLASLKEVHPFGVGGPKMRKEGLECLLPMEEFQMMGFTEILLSIPRLIRQFRQLRTAILERNPAACVLIDYGGFNLRLAKSLRRHGYKGKLIQYISPKVWAWGKGRVKHLAANLDLMLVIFPFETNCYTNSGLTAKYIGNPLVEAVAKHTYTPIPKEEKLLALFPGSRKGEIKLNLKRQLETALAFQADHPEFAIAISIANKRVEPLIRKIVGTRPIRLTPSHQAYDLMQSADLALATSGTVTMELALHEVPTVVVYRVSPLNLFLAGVVFRIRLPFYCMVNIVCNKEVYPELIHLHFQVKRAKKELERMLTSDGSGCREMKEILASDRPSRKGAKEILSLLEGISELGDEVVLDEVESSQDSVLHRPLA